MTIPRSLQISVVKLTLSLTSLSLSLARNVFKAFSLYHIVACLILWFGDKSVCRFVNSRRTDTHIPSKDKKENDYNAISATPAFEPVAVFSSSPVNFSRALKMFLKCFFRTLTASPLARHQISVMHWTPCPVTEYRTFRRWVDK